MNSTTTQTLVEPVTSEAAALADIVAWSAECPAWQRDALRRLSSQERLEETDLSALLAICKGSTMATMPIAANHVRDPVASTGVVTLCALDGLKNVNALAEGERVTFDKNGLTIIYGDNGSGKSGYARVLKKVCRARSTKADTILPNVYANNPGVPTANVEFRVGGQNRSISWTIGQTPDPMLSAISVFDSRAANIHVEQTNDLAYTPLPLRMLAGLAQACHDLKQRLLAEVKALEQQKPAVIAKPECLAGTVVGKLIATLSARTKPTAVTALATLSEQERDRLESLKADLAGDPARTARQLQALRSRVDAIRARLEGLAKAVSDESVTAIRAAAIALNVSSEAAVAAATDLFSGDPLPNIGSDAWKALWEAARAYSTIAYSERPFPVTQHGDRCVLCQQELSPDAADRMRRFESFVKDESKRREDEARATYEQMIRALESARFTPSDLVRHVATISDELGASDLALTVRRSALGLLWRARAILLIAATNDALALPPIPELPLASLCSKSADLESRVAALLAEENSDARKALIAERDALADRAWLSLVKDDVLAHIERLKTIDAVNKAAKETATNRITSKSNELAQALVTNALRTRFAQEIDRLGVTGLAIELRQEKTSQGIPFFRVTLMNKPDQKVGDVLSEGEHRCVALAAFLAELATVDSRSAIVFDDPVSSLDHMHREAVAARLAEEGIDRQIVVFTHDIAFLFLLYEACREQGEHVAFRSISRGREFSGFCNPNPPPNAQPVDKVIAAMRKYLEERKIHYGRGNQEEWYRTVRSLQEQLRTTWERAVEEALAPVIKRLANKVYTNGLPKVTVLNMDDCRTMREAFGRCSELLHSESEALNSPLPPPQRVETEIAALAGWLASVRQRQDKAKISV